MSQDLVVEAAREYLSRRYGMVKQPPASIYEIQKKYDVPRRALEKAIGEEKIYFDEDMDAISGMYLCPELGLPLTKLEAAGAQRWLDDTRS